MYTVRHLLTVIKQKGVISVSADCSLVKAAKVMSENNISALLVMTENVLRGILTERDITRAIARVERCDISVSVFMTHWESITEITPDTTLENALVLMNRLGVRHLPVVENNVVIGVLSMRDLVNAIAQSQESVALAFQAALSHST